MLTSCHIVEENFAIWWRAPAGKYWIKLRIEDVNHGTFSETEPINVDVVYPDIDLPPKEECPDDSPYFLHRKAYTQWLERAENRESYRRVNYIRPVTPVCDACEDNI